MSFRTAFALLAFCLLPALMPGDTRSAACAASVYVYDFEGGLPTDLNVAGATVTREHARVLSGVASLDCDTQASGNDWNEFLQTKPESARLQPYHRYRIRFDYRVLSAGPNTFYYLLRSEAQRTHGGGYDQMFWFSGVQDATGNVQREFEIAGLEDMYLIIGIFGAGRLIVDDVHIEDLGLPREIQVAPIAPSQAPPYESQLKWIEQQRQQNRTTDRLRRMAVILCNEGAGAKAVPDRMVSDLQPDYINWNPIGPLGAEYGIRTSASAMEYQGYYFAEGQEYWEDRFDLFTGSGFLVTLEEDLHQDETWGRGGYSTCQNGRNWNRIFRKELLPVLDRYEDICQDNLTWSNFNMNGGFCQDCETGFRDYLQSRYAAPALLEMGVDTDDSFSIRAYVRAHPHRRGMEALRDPLLREFIKYQNQSQLAAWCGHVVACKQRGIELGRDVAVYGNQTGIDVYPYAMALSVFNDAIEVEGHANPFIYLLARGSGIGRKAVFVRGGLTRDGRPNLSVDYWKARFGLGLTFGGQRVLSLGWNHHETGNPDIPDYIDDPQLYEFFQHYSAWLREHRPLFNPERSFTRTAVVWSYPTQMWRAFMPLELHPHAQQSEFQRVGNWLMERHLPFDVMLFGHPDPWDDSETLAELNRYQDVILPGVDCLSADQRTALRTWAAISGNRLWKTGPFADRDENFGSIQSEEDLLQYAATLVFDDRAEANLASRATLQTDAPASVIVHPYVHAEQGWVAVHVFNTRSDTVDGQGPDSPPFALTVQIPSPLHVDTARLVSYEQETQDLEFRVDPTGICHLRVPAIRHYAMVVLSHEETLKSASAQATHWIDEERAAVRAMMRR